MRLASFPDCFAAVDRHGYVQNPGPPLHKILNPPLVYLSSVYLVSSHVTRSPRSSPSVLHTASNELLEVGMAWERGCEEYSDNTS